MWAEKNARSEATIRPSPRGLERWSLPPGGTRDVPTHTLTRAGTRLPKHGGLNAVLHLLFLETRDTPCLSFPTAKHPSNLSSMTGSHSRLAASTLLYVSLFV